VGNAAARYRVSPGGPQSWRPVEIPAAKGTWGNQVGRARTLEALEKSPHAFEITQNGDGDLHQLGRFESRENRHAPDISRQSGSRLGSCKVAEKGA
jgi:hypothetical protein